MQLDGLVDSSSDEDEDDGAKRNAKRGKFEEEDEDEEVPSHQAEVEDVSLYVVCFVLFVFYNSTYTIL